MKWWNFCFFSVLCISLCGCVTTSKHTKRADRATASYARRTTDVINRLHGSDINLQPVLQNLEQSTRELEKVALADPAFRIPPQAVSGVLGIVAMLTGPGCLVGGGLALKKILECRQLGGLVKDLTEMDKEESKSHVIKHKVKV